MRNIETAGIVVLVLYWFHLLRNLSPIYFVVLMLAIIVFMAVSYANRQQANQDLCFWILLLLWIFASVVTIAVEPFYGSSIVGLIRFWSVMPLIFACMIMGTGEVNNKIKWFVIFYVIASLSYPLQYLIGPVEWFAEPSERAGVERFAALTGSLTSYGSSVGIASIGAFGFFSLPVAFGLFVVFTIGGILSLQKAALANLALALILGCWIRGDVNRRVVLRIAVLSIPVVMLGWIVVSFYSATDAGSASVFEIALRSVEGVISGRQELTSDVTFFESVIDRITELPAMAFDYHGWRVALFGAGVYGGAGALGYPDIPTAHNGVVELILIFGAIIGSIICVYLLGLLFFSIWLHLQGREKAPVEAKFLLAALFLFLLNNAFTGGGFFQPVSASMFWLVMFRLRFLNKCRIVNKI